MRNRCLLVAVCTVLVAGLASAGEPTPAGRATARQLMLEGRNLRFDHDLRGALEKFQAADALMGVPTTGLEVATTQAELGLLVEALDTCARVIRHPETPGEPEPFGAARAAAKSLRDDLRRRTPSLRFVFPPGVDRRGLELRVDGVIIPEEAHGTPRLVNPGRHELVVVSGTYRRVRSVVLREGESRDVALTPPTGSGPPVVEDEARNPWVWGGFATAAVGGAVGVVTGALAWSQRNELDDACPGRLCSADDMEKVDRARGYANVSTYAFVVGGIGAAIGLGALWSDSEGKEPKAAARVVRCAAGTLCVGGSF